MGQARTVRSTQQETEKNGCNSEEEHFPCTCEAQPTTNTHTNKYNLRNWRAKPKDIQTNTKDKCHQLFLFFLRT